MRALFWFAAAAVVFCAAFGVRSCAVAPRSVVRGGATRGDSAVPSGVRVLPVDEAERSGGAAEVWAPARASGWSPTVRLTPSRSVTDAQGPPDQVAPPLSAADEVARVDGYAAERRNVRERLREALAGSDPEMCIRSFRTVLRSPSDSDARVAVSVLSSDAPDSILTPLRGVLMELFTGGSAAVRRSVATLGPRLRLSDQELVSIADSFRSSASDVRWVAAASIVAATDGQLRLPAVDALIADCLGDREGGVVAATVVGVGDAELGPLAAAKLAAIWSGHGDVPPAALHIQALARKPQALGDAIARAIASPDRRWARLSLVAARTGLDSASAAAVVGAARRVVGEDHGGSLAHVSLSTLRVIDPSAAIAEARAVLLRDAAPEFLRDLAREIVGASASR